MSAINSSIVNRRVYYIVPIVVAIGAMVGTMLLKAGSQNDHPGSDVAAVESPNATDRDRAAKAIIEERRRVVTELQDIVKRHIADEGERRKIAENAIRLLGELRADAAVPLLVENLTFEPEPGKPLKGKRLVAPWETYPCVGALIDIGLPALDPLLASITTNEGPLRTGLTAVVIQKVLSDRVAFAYVQERLEQEQDEARRERLRALLLKWPQ